MRLLLPVSEPGSTPASSGGGVRDGTVLEELYATAPTPRLRANFVVSLEGAIEADGRSEGLSGPGDRRLFFTLRALTDVIVVGAGTVRGEDYGPARVHPEAAARRERRSQRPVPTIAVVTRSADLDPAARLFSGDRGQDGRAVPSPVILTCASAPSERRAALARVADVVICGDQDVDPRTALDALRERGLAQVLCEGGPSLFTSLAAEGLIDEICLTVSPVLVGPGRTSLTVGEGWSEAHRWRLASLAEQDGFLFARYLSALPASPGSPP